MKLCTDCHKILPDENFYRDHNRIDGLSQYCKEHIKARVRETKKKKELNNPGLKIFFGWGVN